MGNCLSSSSAHEGGLHQPKLPKPPASAGDPSQHSPQPVVGGLQGASSDGLATGARPGLPSLNGTLEATSIPPEGTHLSSNGAAIPWSFASNAKATNNQGPQSELRRHTGTSASGSSFAFNAPSSPGQTGVQTGVPVDVGAVLMELSRGHQPLGMGTPQRGGSAGTEGETSGYQQQSSDDAEHQQHAQQLTVTQLNEEIQDLRFIGSGVGLPCNLCSMQACRLSSILVTDALLCFLDLTGQRQRV